MMEYIHDTTHDTPLLTPELTQFTTSLLHVDGRKLNTELLENCEHMRRNLVFACAVIKPADSSDTTTKPFIAALVDTRERFEFEAGKPAHMRLMYYIERFTPSDLYSIRIYPCTVMQRNSGIYDPDFMHVITNGRYHYTIVHRLDESCSMSLKFHAVAHAAASGALRHIDCRALPQHWPTTEHDVSLYRNFAVATALHHTPPEIITDALVKEITLKLRHAPSAHAYELGESPDSTTTKLSAVLGLLDQVHRATFWQDRP